MTPRGSGGDGTRHRPAHPPAGGRRVVLKGLGRGSRLDRLSEQLRQELSAMMLTELKDERVRLATVSGVTISSDLRSARVMVSAIGTD